MTNHSRHIAKAALTSVLLTLAGPLGSLAQTSTGVLQQRGNARGTVRPQDDFYAYACSDWLASHPLPPSLPAINVFNVLQSENERLLLALKRELLTSQFADGTLESKAATLWRLATDTARRERDGVGPVMQWMKDFEQAKTRKQLLETCLAWAPYRPCEAFFSLSFSNEGGEEPQMAVVVSQGQLSLGQKRCYLDASPAARSLRQAFVRYVADLFERVGFSRHVAERKAKNVLEVETARAKEWKSSEEQRQGVVFGRMSLADFSARFPHLHLEQLLKVRGVRTEHLRHVKDQRGYVQALDRLLGSMGVAPCRDYLEWQLLDATACWLDGKTRHLHDRFYNQLSLNATLAPPATGNPAEDLLEEALGRMYVERHVDELSLHKVETMVKNIQAVLSQAIAAQDWMDASTRAKAQEKLRQLKLKIGHPIPWPSFAGLELDGSASYYDNCLEYVRFARYQQYLLARSEQRGGAWLERVQSINAHYDFKTNSICIPAGILQKPFFDPADDEAHNYGAIGSVIGHEMLHGFDDTGALYDSEGKRADWWTEADHEAFRRRTSVLAECFSQLEALPGQPIDGQRTLTENLADHGGVTLAFAAYRAATARKPLATKDGHTPDQRFFLAFARLYAQNISRAETLRLLRQDPHAPDKWRVNGILPHVNAWREAFGLEPSDALYLPPERRFTMW